MTMIFQNSLPTKSIIPTQKMFTTLNPFEFSRSLFVLHTTFWEFSHFVISPLRSESQSCVPLHWGWCSCSSREETEGKVLRDGRYRGFFPVVSSLSWLYKQISLDIFILVFNFYLDPIWISFISYNLLRTLSLSEFPIMALLKYRILV